MFNHWNSSNILRTQPLEGLIKPYITLVQRYHFILSLLQLIFMISFTVYYTPTTCSLASMFNVSATRCSSSSSTNVSDDALKSSITQHRSWIAVLWLIWPIILLVRNVIATFENVRQAFVAYRRQSNKMVFQSKDLRFSITQKLVKALVPLLLYSFCGAVFLWIYAYFRSETYELYVAVTAMVLLTGWIANLTFFGAMNKDFSIFLLTVQKITVKIIPSFMLFFGFTVVGYSLAIYALRMSACLPNKFIYLDETFFSVLSSAFGIGDLFEVTVTACAGGHTQYLFQFVYFGYVCATMIILLNVLIAMMNNCYEKAKQRAGNMWRFEILCTMKNLYSQKSLIKAIKKCGILDTGSFRKSIRDEKRVSLFFNEELKRYYMLIVVPVDKHIENSGTKWQI